MGSSSSVAPPDGFELDAPNAMQPQRTRLLRTLGDVGVNAMTDIYGRIKRWESDPSLPSSRGDTDIGADAFALGPGMLLPGFGRAAGGLGAAGGRMKLLRSEDAQKIIARERAAGKSTDEIAEALNSHFRLEEGTVTKRHLHDTTYEGAAGGQSERSTWTPEMVNHLKALEQTFAGTRGQNKTIITNFRELHPEYTGSDATILTMRYRQKAWGGVNEATGAADASAPTKAARDFELGAFGGRPSTSNRITGDDIGNMMRSEGYENVKVQNAKTGDSSYATGDPPGNPPRSVSDVPMVRVPTDGHVGRPTSGREIGNRIDMGTPDSTTRTVNIPEPGVYQNAAGEPFANPENVRGFLQWRKGDLVSPDAAPGLTRETDRSLRGNGAVPILKRSPGEPPTYPDVASTIPDGPIQDPRQLKLLSRGLPPGFILDDNNRNAMVP